MPNTTEVTIATLFGLVGLGLIVNHLRTPYDDENDDERAPARGGTRRTRRKHRAHRNGTRKA